MIDCESTVVVFHLLWVDVDQRENVFDCPAFAILIFGGEIGDFKSCARVEVFAEDTADSTPETTTRCRWGGGGGGGGCRGRQGRMSRLGEYFDIPDEHIHMRENADTVIYCVECFRLGCEGGCEHDGGCECEEG